jgi:tetratricopeptide (TPR) repeat protein
MGVLCIVTFTAFFPALKNGFTNCDDDKMVTNNPRITSLARDNVTSFFTEPHEYLYHPLVLLSYAVEYHFFKLRPLPYHATNILIHLCNTVLVFLLIYLLCRTIPVAFIAALLFALHPLRVESVAWITERKDVLSACFYFGSLVGYLAYRGGGGRKLFYGLSFASYLLSLLSKPMAVTLPFVLVLFDLFQGRKIDRKSLFEKAPFFIIAFVFAGIALLVHYPAGGKDTQLEPFAAYHRPFIGTYGIVFYLTKTIAPVNLSSLYEFPAYLLAAPGIHLIPAFLIVLVLTALIVYSRKYTNKAVFGALFFLITILPVLQILPIGGKSTPADRFTYIPAIGLCYISAEFLYWLYREKFRASRAGRSLLTAAAAAVCIVLATLTWQRCQVWKSSVSLWNNVLKQYPDNIVGYINRADGHRDTGDLDSSIADYSEAIKRHPSYYLPYNNRAGVYMAKGDLKSALADYNTAIGLAPNAPFLYYNRGNVYASARDIDQAIADYSRAIELNPRYAEAYHNRGSAYSNQGEIHRSIADYTRAIALSPGYAQAYFNRGNVFAGRGETDRALADYDRALTLYPGYLPANLGRARVYAQKGEYLKAWEDIGRIEQRGYTVEPAFIEELEKSSPRPPQN